MASTVSLVVLWSSRLLCWKPANYIQNMCLCIITGSRLLLHCLLKMHLESAHTLERVLESLCRICVISCKQVSCLLLSNLASLYFWLEYSLRGEKTLQCVLTYESVCLSWDDPLKLTGPLPPITHIIPEYHHRSHYSPPSWESHRLYLMFPPNLHALPTLPILPAL